MRSYGQYCSLAKALDAVGDRWSLLVVRELWLRGECRYTDLRHGLPGIATNLLAERLRQLETAGVIERADAPPPVVGRHSQVVDPPPMSVIADHDGGDDEVVQGAHQEEIGLDLQLEPDVAPGVVRRHHQVAAVPQHDDRLFIGRSVGPN